MDQANEIANSAYAKVDSVVVDGIALSEKNAKILGDILVLIEQIRDEASDIGSAITKGDQVAMMVEALVAKAHDDARRQERAHELQMQEDMVETAYEEIETIDLATETTIWQAEEEVAVVSAESTGGDEGDNDVFLDTLKQKASVIRNALVEMVKITTRPTETTQYYNPADSFSEN